MSRRNGRNRATLPASVNGMLVLGYREATWFHPNRDNVGVECKCGRTYLVRSRYVLERSTTGCKECLAQRRREKAEANRQRKEKARSEAERRWKASFRRHRTEGTDKDDAPCPESTSQRPNATAARSAVLSSQTQTVFAGHAT